MWVSNHDLLWDAAIVSDFRTLVLNCLAIFLFFLRVYVQFWFLSNFKGGFSVLVIILFDASEFVSNIIFRRQLLIWLLLGISHILKLILKIK